MESQLNQFLRGTGWRDFGMIPSTNQQSSRLMICRGRPTKTLNSGKEIARLQDKAEVEVADLPFAVITKKMNGAGDLSEEINHAVNENEKAFLKVMERQIS